MTESYSLNAGIEDAFAATSWGKKLQKRAAKANMTDFDRFKATIAKSQRARRVRKAVEQLQKAA
jgi:large subunit ribosomal protein L14e